jgi:hypothetical protein
VRIMMGRLARSAGIAKRVHPHGLRHAHAAELSWAGTPINVISKQLGHSNSATPSRYLDQRRCCPMGGSAGVGGARMIMVKDLARCEIRGCPVRYAAGGNRLCAEHAREVPAELSVRLADMTSVPVGVPVGTDRRAAIVAR